MTENIELPPLPDSPDDNGRYGHGDMKRYAHAAIEADRQQRRGEPVYLVRFDNGFWQECSKGRFDYLKDAIPSSKEMWCFRVLYTAPQPAAPAPAQQYYYRVTGCRADKATAPDCICWHDKGTGPFPERKEGDEVGGVLVSWRDKPQPAEPFCVDEGCPHHGTKHVCINRHAEPVNVPSDEELIGLMEEYVPMMGTGFDSIMKFSRALLAQYGSKS